MNANLSLADAKEVNPIGSVGKNARTKNISFLNGILSNEYALFTKTLSYHWNITGPRFKTIHTFLEDQYKVLLTMMDDVAERVRVLGGVPISRMDDFSKRSTLNDSLSSDTSSDIMINDLFRDHLLIQEQIKIVLKEKNVFNDDPGTEDFLVGVLKEHEKISWMLKSHLS